MAHPFFSIIIPTYNSEQTIASCLESILVQIFTDYEILVIDGQSTDQTTLVLQAFQNKCPRLHWISEKDSGIYEAMNKGISMAKGQWLYFLGSDDVFFSNSVLQTIFSYTKIRNNGFIYGNVLINGQAGWAESDAIYDGSFDVLKMLYKNICHQSIFYHYTLFQRYGYYNTRYSICADYDLNLRIAASLELKYIDIIIAVFKGGNSSFIQRDLYFEQEKNKNIVQYFHFRLFEKAFRRQQYFLKQAMKDAYSKKFYYYSFIALSAYIYHSFMRLLWD